MKEKRAIKENEWKGHKREGEKERKEKEERGRGSGPTTHIEHETSNANELPRRPDMTRVENYNNNNNNKPIQR